jgi:predicted anti-sigma-YlaC factor YlaD
MNCEEFAIAGLDKDLYADDMGSAAAREHLRNCGHCAALYESSLALRADLRELGHVTSDAETPSRVEMRLRQEFRTRHKTDKNRERVVLAGWVLAAATLLLAVSSLVVWNQHKTSGVAKLSPSSPAVIAHTYAVGPELGGTLIAANDTDEFALIPGAIPGSLDDSTVVRVQMQRGSLGA